jgi:hypothetical protein
MKHPTNSHQYLLTKKLRQAAILMFLTGSICFALTVAAVIRSEARDGLTDLHLLNGGHFNHPMKQWANQTQLKEDGQKMLLHCFSHYSEHSVSIMRPRGRKHFDKQSSVCLEALENTHKHHNASNYLYTQIKFNVPLEYISQIYKAIQNK